MGEISDDIINGLSCSWCGIYFKEEHGYPVLCKDCQEDTNPKEMEDLGLQPATLKEM